MRSIDGGVTRARGFRANGVRAGIKMQGNDVGFIASDTPAIAAAVFTTNQIQAAPVMWSQRNVLKKGNIQAIIANSGNANACTGGTGLEHAAIMGSGLASQLGISTDAVLVASTGVIGVPLPIDKVVAVLDALVRTAASTPEAGEAAAQAIMTTDTFMKQAAVEIELGGQSVVIGGMSKGSGMIHPNMATMLGFITTDVAIAQPLLDKALTTVTQDTFNMISVDGDTSTNDMLVVLANGQAHNPPITCEDADYSAFVEGLQAVAQSLAKQIVRDGEGATKLLEVRVRSAGSKEQARRLIKSMLTSNLVKTAFFGEDPNWGRLLAAMGYAGVPFDASRIRITFISEHGQVVVMDESEPFPFDEHEAKHVLSARDIDVIVDLHEGVAEAVGWGCDLSYEYVRINGEYRT